MCWSVGDGLEVAEVTEVHSKSPIYGSQETIDWTVAARAANTERHRDARAKASSRSTGDNPCKPLAACCWRSPPLPSPPARSRRRGLSKPIRVLVPFPPGGGTDIVAREVTQARDDQHRLDVRDRQQARRRRQPRRRPAAKSPPDGYTIVLGQTSNLAINPTLYSKLPYDPVKDLVPIGLVASAPLVLVVPSSSPYKTLADLVAAAKAKPGEVNFASPGNGTVAHLTGEKFQKAAGIRFQHVPYKGANQALTDVISGQVAALRLVGAFGAAADPHRQAPPARRHVRASASTTCRRRRRSARPATRASTPSPGSASSPRPERRRTWSPS